jgi:catechol 2,3-dioxygenase-like lactoylglutathione lyase family enzyme
MTNTQLDPTTQTAPSPTASEKPKPDYDRTTQDVGNVLGMEHVNLAVTDRDLADRFYVSALGFTRDPYIDLGLYGTTWVNLGSQQFHLIHGSEPQVFRGRIGLVVPDPEAVVRRLDRLLNRVPIVAESQAAYDNSDGQLTVTCPWGNTLCVHGPDDVPGFGIGMPYVEVDVEPGRAGGIAAFYQTILGSPASVETGDDGATRAIVEVGLHQQIRFRETTDPIADYDGHHIAIYLHDFSSPYDQLVDRNLISLETDENEYRFIDIVDPGSGDVLTRLEHEVRSMFHPMFGRALVNRDANQGLGRRYRRGQDTQPGLHQGGVG